MAFTRELFSHLSDSQWNTLTRMISLFGEAAMPAIITDDINVQKEKIDAFRTYEGHLCEKSSTDAIAGVTETLSKQFQAEQEALTARFQQEQQQLGAQSQLEIARLRAEFQAVAQTQRERPREERPKPIKLDVSHFEGKVDENITRWFLECEVAMNAQRITDESLKVAFGMSNLKRKGLAHEWAYTMLLRDQEVFPTWERFKALLYQFHQGKHMAHNHRAKFLSCKQGKRSVYEYVQELRKLAASIVGEEISESIKITILMEGMNIGPARTQLFRINPTNFEEALRIALEEDNSQKRSGSRKYPTDVAGDGGDAATPMDVSAIDASRSNERCYNCNRKGHYSRDCRQPQRGGGRGSPRGTGGGRGNRRVRFEQPGNAAPRQ